MTEDEVNLKCKEWLEQNRFKYKGILNPGAIKTTQDNTGFGQVPVPDGTRCVLIDHQGINDQEHSLIWVEAKGSGVGMSRLLEGFIRMVYACYHGGGSGLLAVPSYESDRLLEQQDFLKRVGVSCDRNVGILDVGKSKAYWL